MYELEHRLRKQQGRQGEALEALTKSNEYYKQIDNEKNITHMQNIRVKYEQDKKEAELNHLKTKHQQERRRITMGIYLIMVILIFAVLMIAFLLNSARLRAKNNQIMKELERTRVNFFTNVTHEFRTPLTIIIAAAKDIIDNTPDDIHMKKDATDIIRNGKVMLNLVNQMLEISKMRSEYSRTLNYHYGDFISFVTMVVEGCSHFGEKRNVSISFKSEIERLDINFVPDYTIRILHNLISNAVKFSKPDSQVEISLKYSSQRTNSLELIIHDTGSGLNEQQRRDIFKPFYQASEDSGFIGTGIGLSLVKLTIEALGGEIEIESQPDKGSSFIVSLPINYNKNYSTPLDMSDWDVSDSFHNESETIQIENETFIDKDAPNILIVEDNPEVAYWQMRQLDSQYNFSFAMDGLEGLKKAEEIVPDLIITDIMMPGIDGYEFCRRIRNSELLSHIPVIMITARTSKEDKIKGLSAGADSYIEKPFDSDILSIRVKMLLEQRAKLRVYFSELSTDPNQENSYKDNFSPDSGNCNNDDVEKRTVNTGISFCKDKFFIDKLNIEIVKQMEQGSIDYTELGCKFSITRTQLNRKIKAITGMTTTEYILRMRIKMAKELLTSTDLPIGEIAYKCGVDDISYFGTIFKKHTGVSPTQYRSSNS